MLYPSFHDSDRHSDRCSNPLSEAATDLPSHEPLDTPVDLVRMPLSQFLSDGAFDIVSLTLNQTYSDVSQYFDRAPTACGVLIRTDTAAAPIVGMISRRRILEWRSQAQHWRQARSRSLIDMAPWWQQAQTFLQIDAQLSLQDAIHVMLEQNAPALQDSHPDPVVIHLPNVTGLIDPCHLFSAYAQFAKPALTDPADRELESLRRQHQLILNAVGEGVYGVDLQGHVTFVNPAAADMIGWEMHDLIGRSMHAVLHHSHEDGSHYPREECPIYLAFQDGIIHRVTDDVFWRKDGTHFPVEYISTPMRDEQGKLIGAVVAFRNIAQRKWVETMRQRANEELELKVQERTAELQTVNQQLQELNDLKSRFVSIVCHEFRNPLNNIALSASALGRYEVQLSANQKLEYLTGIADNVERMTQMIDDILVIGKIEAKRMEVRRIRLDVVEFCQDLIAELQTMTPHPLDLISRSKHLMADLDEQLLRSILSNMLSNSMRYSPNHSAVRLKLFRHRGWVVFQVKDEGVGILPDDRPYLFEPFHRGRNVSNVPGTGLGLNIVKRFVDLHQGNIEVESKVGVGTTFTVRLPMQGF